MSEGIFGKDADLAQRLKDRIAFHANEHRHTYEIGKGVMDALVLDLLADFRDAGGVILPVKPNGTVWLIRRRRVVSAVQYSIFEGGDVFVCPFCCAELARTEAGIPRACPECGQPIERKKKP